MTLNKHILIVDDVALNIQLAMMILEEDNYEFSFADSGEEALSLIQQGDVDFNLILLDIMMPGIDGYEVCQELKSRHRWRDVPVIFSTAMVDADSISKGFEVGAIDYISKPYDPEELLTKVKNHIH